ncbi:type II secretion system F family protein, partial [Adlercreutzia murintestinalis]|uniref:type II secretion system F family protein n=1 Tax=Adlercreutzia murintestinalis TaxID=2941325 RepID=UPI002040B130
AAQPLRPLAQRVSEHPALAAPARHAALLAEEQGIALTPEMFVLITGAAALVSGVVVGLMTLSPVCGVAVACLVAIGIFAAAKRSADKNAANTREQIPDALRCMGTCFRSGLSLPQTLQQTAMECSGALGSLFSVAARRLEMGAPPAEALAVMRSSDQVPELSFVAVALDVQHQSGGSIAPVLETARESVISELDLMRSLRVQTAQAKLSASIVTVMPFVLVALFSLMSPDFLAPFFGSLIGVALLALALIMQLSGVLAVRRMLRIDAG